MDRERDNIREKSQYVVEEEGEEKAGIALEGFAGHDMMGGLVEIFKAFAVCELYVDFD